MREFEVENKIWQKDLSELVQDKIFENFANKTVLITGATGLIGSELVFAFLCANRLKNLNVSIFALVRNKEKAMRLFKNVYDDTNLYFICQNIEEPLTFNAEIDYIIHCANITQSKTMIEKPVEVINSTISGTKNILDLAKKINAKSTLYLSSIEVYGEVSKVNIDEEDLGILDTKNVRNCYPLSKKMAENLCICYSNQHNIDVKIARLTQTFGAGISIDDNRIFAQIAKCIIKNKDIILKTDGLSAKNYCYITDAILALLTILFKGKNQEIYNVANSKTLISIKDLALKMIEKYQSSNLKFEIDDNKCYPKNSIIELNSKKLKDLGWNSKIDLDEMFERLINYLKEEI